MSMKNTVNKKHTTTRALPTAKAGKRAGSLSPEAQAQRTAQAQARKEQLLAMVQVGVDEVIMAFRTHNVYEARGVARRYSFTFDQTRATVAQAEQTFSNNVGKLTQLIAKRRDRGGNLTFREVAHAVTYREFMQAMVNYKEGK